MESKKRNNKGPLIIVGVLLLIAIGGGAYWYTQFKVPHDNAVSAFKIAQENVEHENKLLAASVSAAQAILDTKPTAYAEKTLTDLQVAISKGQESKRNVPELPQQTAEIISATSKLNEPIDYSLEIEDLKTKQEAAENSIKQYQQVLNPTGDFIILRLKEVKSIVNLQAVTEENDPNGNLNKQGGYTSATFFASGNLNQDEISGANVIEKGTDAGGSIEVYQTVEEAEARNTYLSAFDGGMLSSGSHTVVGTIVVRTSDKLTASQQKDLEVEIVTKLLELK